MEPIIVLNLKAYRESAGEKGIRLCEIASEVSLLTGVRIIVAPQMLDLKDAAKTGTDIFAQHVDPNEPGAYTGDVTLEAIKEAGCKGTILNHSEHRIPLDDVRKVVEMAKNFGIETLVCAASPRESATIAALTPTYVAVEPPELIGSGISVSTAKPEVITDTIKIVREIGDIPVLCGAGVSNASDVRKAIELGADGVLLASAFVKAADPKALLMEMANALKG